MSEDIHFLYEKILDLIFQSNCLDYEKKWVNLDHLWHEIDRLDSISDYLGKYLDLIRKDMWFNKLILTDPLFGTLGSIPPFIFASQKMEQRIPFVIWKEWTRPATGDSSIYGHIIDNDQVLICLDVIDHGTTAVKIYNDLKTINKTFNIAGIISICTTERDGFSIIKKYTDILPKSIITLNDLLTKYHEKQGQRWNKL